MATRYQGFPCLIFFSSVHTFLFCFLVLQKEILAFSQNYDTPNYTQREQKEGEKEGRGGLKRLTFGY